MFWVCHMFNIFFSTYVYNIFPMFIHMFNILWKISFVLRMLNACSIYVTRNIFWTYAEILPVYTVFRNLEFIWFDTLRTCILMCLLYVHVYIQSFEKLTFTWTFILNHSSTWVSRLAEKKTLIKICAENSLTTRPSR